MGFPASATIVSLTRARSIGDLYYRISAQRVSPRRQAPPLMTQSWFAFMVRSYVRVTRSGPAAKPRSNTECRRDDRSGGSKHRNGRGLHAGRRSVSMSFFDKFVRCRFGKALSHERFVNVGLQESQRPCQKAATQNSRRSKVQASAHKRKWGWPTFVSAVSAASKSALSWASIVVCTSTLSVLSLISAILTSSSLFPEAALIAFCA